MQNNIMIKKIILTIKNILKDIIKCSVCILIGTILICVCLEHGWLLCPNQLQSVHNEEFCILGKIVLGFMPIAICIKGAMGKYKVDVAKSVEVAPRERIDEVILIHEAGHIFLVKHFGYELINVSFDRTEISVGQTTWRYPVIPSKEDLLHGIIIAYGGFYAEMFLNHEVTIGSIKDFENANDLIRQYLLISESISFAGYEKDLIEQKSIEISNQCRELAKDLISSHINEVKDISLRIVEVLTDNENNTLQM